MMPHKTFLNPIKANDIGDNIIVWIEDWFKERINESIWAERL